MTSSARDLRYGRRGGRWAETWTPADEARYRAAKTRLELVCSECGRPFLYVTKGAGILPVCCGYRCRQDRNLRLAKDAKARRKAS